MFQHFSSFFELSIARTVECECSLHSNWLWWWWNTRLNLKRSLFILFDFKTFLFFLLSLHWNIFMLLSTKKNTLKFDAKCFSSIYILLLFCMLVQVHNRKELAQLKLKANIVEKTTCTWKKWKPKCEKRKVKRRRRKWEKRQWRCSTYISEVEKLKNHHTETPAATWKCHLKSQLPHFECVCVFGLAFSVEWLLFCISFRFVNSYEKSTIFFVRAIVFNTHKHTAVSYIACEFVCSISEMSSQFVNYWHGT